jgi:hypothetical protein
VLAETDPVPREALAAASAAFGWRDMDAALAALTTDSLTHAPAVVVRGTPPRLLGFATDTVTVDLEVTTEDGAVRMLGQIAPAQPADVVVEYFGGVLEAFADPIGRFSVDGVPIGWLRVGVTTGGEAAPVKSHTEWFRI